MARPFNVMENHGEMQQKAKDADENNEHLHFQLRYRVVYSLGNIMSSALRRSSTLVRSLANVQARRLHSSGFRAAASGSGSVSPLNADDGKLGTKLYHAVNLVILAGVPAVIATSPSALTLPLDVVLGLAMPLHAHIGMNYVISDYVPKPFRGQARGAMLVASVVAALGLLKLNLTGPGITETLKSTWRTPKALEDESKNTKSDSSKA